MSATIFPTGVTIYNPEKCWSGYTILQAAERGALLIDMNGNEVRMWEGLQGFPNKMLPGGYVMGSLGERNPKYGLQDQTDLVQVDWDGNIVWKFDKAEYIEDPGEEPQWMARQHHDYQREGNTVGYYVPGSDPKTNSGNTLILAHKNVHVPAISDKMLLDDVIYEVDWDGDIVWEWKVSDHFEELGFDAVVPVSGQTYSRKMDYNVLSTLAGIAQSASKFATDLRLLCHLKEVEEPFEKNQIGSSAMPYKRNPMRCERICSLARYVIVDAGNPAITTATQWFERTLDDSANKRISIPEAFLAVDAILNIYMNVASGLVVHPKVIRRHVMEELPFMASENIMMDAVKRGGDRQELHERIRVLSQEAGRNVKDLGLSNNLIDLMAEDPAFGMSREELTAHLEPERYIGRCPEQVEEFLSQEIAPVLEKYAAALGGKETELKV